MEGLIEMLRRVANEMEAGDWHEANAAVLIVRDAETGMLTYCDWGDTGNLVADAAKTRPPL